MSQPASRKPKGFAALRLASRLARRETVRRPWRTLLVALLVAVPVAGMVVAAVWVRTENQTPIEQWQANNGLADLYATPGSPVGAPVESGGPSLNELLPAGSRTISYRAEHNRVLRTVEGDRASAEITNLPMADPLTAPIMQVTSGRAPQDADEVFLTREVARDLNVEVGDTLRLERPEEQTWQVVGVGERRAWWDSSMVVLGSDATFPWRDESTGYSTRRVLIDLPETVTAAQLAELSRFPEGVSFAPGIAPLGMPGGSYYQDLPSSDDAAKVAWSWVIGAVVLTVVGIVIAAAFAAGARRQLTMLGQLAANGASPGTLRRVLFLQGTWTGMLGAALGLGLAAATLAVAAPHLDNLLNRDADPYTVRTGDLLPILALGITAATLAALVPARTTARIPVLAALAGRRPLRPVPPWLTVTGVAVGAAGLGLLGLAALGANGGGGGGTVWALTAIIGGVAILLGACAVAPGYVSVLEPLASRLRGSSRLAARSLARQRTRTGAVVSAVCATSALAIGASALVLSADAKDAGEPEWMRADEVHVEAQAIEGQFDEQGGRSQRPTEVPADYVDELEAAIPGSEVHHIGRVGVPHAGEAARWQVLELVPDEPTSDGEFAHLHLMSGPFPQYAAVADGDLARLYELPAEARRALEEAGVAAIGSLPVRGTATVSVVAEHYDQSTPTTVPQAQQLVPPFQVRIVPADLALGSLPRILVTPERAEALGLEPKADLLVLRADRSLTEAERTAVQDISDDYRDRALDSRQPNDEIVSVHSNVLYPNETLSPRVLEGLLAAAALVLSLFVVCVSLALAAAETRDERDVLVVVGAPPPTMRHTSGSKALLLTLLGAALAVPVGFLPVSVFTAASKNDLPLVFPWRMVLLLVAAVPLVAAAVTTVFSGLTLRLRPVRVSTMAFD